MANIRSLSSLRQKEEEENKNNELYAGGVDNRGGGSGLAVQNPGDRVAGAGAGAGVGGGDVFSRIMDKAQEGGQRSEYTGDGPADGKPRRKIRMYKSGFVVDNGPFRSSEDPTNKLFLEQLAMGLVPSELMTPAPITTGGLRTPSPPPVMEVCVEDLRDEEYVAPAYIAYSGEGMTLAGSSGSSSAAGAAGAVIVDPAALPAVPEVDAGQPCTTVQVKLLNGKKIRVKLNTSHSVAQLCAFIVQDGLGGSAPGTRFILSSGFPPKDLELPCVGSSNGDLNSTSVATAGLLGAAITLKAV